MSVFREYHFTQTTRIGKGKWSNRRNHWRAQCPSKQCGHVGIPRKRPPKISLTWGKYERGPYCRKCGIPISGITKAICKRMFEGGKLGIYWGADFYITDNLEPKPTGTDDLRPMSIEAVLT